MFENDNSVNTKIFTNAYTSYSGKIKAGATSIGDDNMSKSIFSKIDTIKKDGILSQEEIDAAMPTLGEIIQSAIEGAKGFASTMFGPKPSEQEIRTEGALGKAYNKIMKYASENPDDAKLQEYAKKLQEMYDSGRIVITEIDRKTTFGCYRGSDDTIMIDPNKWAGHEDVLMEVLLHEVGHALDGDSWSSLAEEYDVQYYASNLVTQINGEPSIVTKKQSIDEFVANYEGRLSDVSPGHTDWPKMPTIRLDFQEE